VQRTIVPGISLWSRWQADRGVFFNSYLVEGEAGAFAVDPLATDDPSVLRALEGAGVKTIVVTNRDHERASASFAAALGARVFASEPDAAALVRPPDAVVRDDEELLGWRAIVLDGYKTPGELVLVNTMRRTAISGDAFWGDPAGSLRLMPDEMLADPVRALLSARRLRECNLLHLFVGDGTPAIGNAHALLGAMLDARLADAPARIVNLDELVFRRYTDRAPFTGSFADAGRVIGAERLGYAVERLPPGGAGAPLHWHTREEELFIIFEGTPTLLTPAGERVLRPGDLVSFATAPYGAHRLENRTAADVLYLALANVDAGDVCNYPDSKKVLVEGTGLLVRSEPELDYFDGE
jgi:uncharacterized cupin superfamily protein